MRRICLGIVALVIALMPIPASANHLVDLARCEGVATLPRLSDSCEAFFTINPGGGVFLIPHAGPAFTGSLRVQVTNPTEGCAIDTFYILGRRAFSTVGGRPYPGDTLLCELSAGRQKLAVTAGVPMIGPIGFALGRFDGVAAAEGEH
jgi:hypothetical protein